MKSALAFGCSCCQRGILQPSKLCWCSSRSHSFWFREVGCVLLSTRSAGCLRITTDLTRLSAKPSPELGVILGSTVFRMFHYNTGYWAQFSFHVFLNWLYICTHISITSLEGLMEWWRASHEQLCHTTPMPNNTHTHTHVVCGRFLVDSWWCPRF